MKKKFASLFLVMALVLTMIPASAFATVDVVEYTNSSTEHTDIFDNNYGVVLSTDKSEYEVGEDIYLKVTGSSLTDVSAVKDSYIGIYSDYNVDPSTTTLAWVYTDSTNFKVKDVEDFIVYGDGATCYADANVGKINTALTTGTYYIIYMVDSDDAAYKGRWAVLPITITDGDDSGESTEPEVPAGPVVATDKATYEYGESIMVTTNYKQTEKDWVGIFKKGTYPSGTALAYYYIGANPETKNINTTSTTDIPTLKVEDSSYYYDGKLLAGDYTIAVVPNDQTAASGAGVGFTDITITGGPDPYEDYKIEIEPEETLPADKVIIEPNLPGLEFYDMLTVGFEKGIPMKVTVPADLDVETEGTWVGMYDAIGGECMVYHYLKEYTPVVNGDTKTYEFDFAEGWTPGAASGKEKEYGYRQFVLYTAAENGAVADRQYFWARQDASGAAVVLDQDTFTYDGQAHQPTIKTAAGKDSVYWTADVPANTNAGTYTFDVNFRYKFGGSTTGTYTILARDVNDATVTVDAIADVTETGSQIKPVPVVKFNGKAMVAGTDYTVAYGENKAVGKGTVTITGKGNFTGTKTVNFNINEKPCTHDWKAATCQAPKTCSLCQATEGSKIACDKNVTIPAVAAKCEVAGKTEGKKCSMCGATTVEPTATPALAHDMKVVGEKAATCTAAGYVDKACANGCGTTQRTAVAKAAHTIVDVPAVEATCTATGLTAGKKCSACGTVTVAQGVVEKLAHTVATSEITKQATAKADGEITNKCACGEIVGTTPIAKAVVTLSKAGAAYTGKVVKAPVVRVKDANGNTIAKDNYTVVAPKNVKKMKDIGRYAYTIKFKGDTYTGSVKVNFEIKPAKTKIKVPAAAKKAITVKWTKAAKKEKVTGYEVMYATNNKFTKGKKQVTVKGAAKVSKKVTGLKSKTKYFVKVRSYKTVKGVKIYSDWSAVKSIKAK